jgi:hypothetical protein
MNPTITGWQTAHVLALVGITRIFCLKASCDAATGAATLAKRGGSTGGAALQLPPDGNHGGNISGDYKNV